MLRVTERAGNLLIGGCGSGVIAAFTLLYSRRGVGEEDCRVKVTATFVQVLIATKPSDMVDRCGGVGYDKDGKVITD